MKSLFIFFSLFLTVFFLSDNLYASNGSVDPTFTASDGRVVTNFGNYGDYGRKVLIQPDGKIVVAAVGTAINSFGDFSICRFNPDGTLDTTFDGDGKVSTSVGIQSSTLFDAVLQPDGKIVAVGAARVSNTTSEDFAAIRYNPDGSLDNSFGSGGIVISPFNDNAYEYATTVAVQPDGKIVLAGITAGGFAVARYNSDGSLDNSFGTNGRITTALSQNGAFPRRAIIQPDGKIIVAGSVTVPIPQNTVNQMVIVRYNSDGSLDTTFDGDGKVQTDFAYYANCSDAVLQSDGKIIAVGQAFLNSGERSKFVAARFNSNGSLDTTFGSGGKTLTSISTGDDAANSVAIRPDGKIVLTGKSRFSVVRYNSDGSIDNTFGTGGISTATVGSEDSANSIAVQADGKLVVTGGATGLASSSKVVLIRFQSNGAIDQSFGLRVAGRVTSVIAGVTDESRAVLVQPDGKIVSAGRCRVTENRHYFCLGRYNSDGTTDSGFGKQGFQTTKIGTGDTDSEVRSIALQSDGKIVVAGRLYDANTNLGRYDFALARYQSNGVLDTTFGDGGIKIVSAPNQYNEAYAVAIQSDGKIIIVGNFDTDPDPGYTRPEMAIVRLNADGTPDTTFGVNGVVVTSGNGGTAYSLAFQTDGKILVAGSGYDSTFLPGFQILRLNVNGSYDNSFGTNGTVLTPFGNIVAEGRSIQIQPDGKILAGGFARVGNRNAFAAARYNLDGTLDTTFGTGGKATTSVSANSVDTANTLILQPNGKVILVGTSVVSNDSNIALIRYNNDGSLDSSFGVNGIVVTDYSSLGNTGEVAAAAVLQSNGKLVVTGSLRSSSIFGLTGRRDFLNVRYDVNTKAPFDFDGDGRTDISIFRPAGGEWWYQRSSDGQVPAVQFGAGTDIIVPGDYTGDGKTDIAFFRPSTGQWFILRSEDNSYFAFPFGSSGDVPVPADYDGDGKTDPSVFRPSNGVWYINKSTGGVSIQPFGLNGDVPVAADYDGDGKSDVAIFRPASGQWWVNRSSAGLLAVTFGDAADRPIQGDYTGDGKADVAFWRPSTGQWFILRSENSSFYAAPFGSNGDVPVPGDYDGDGKFDLGVFRPSNSGWYTYRSTAGIISQQFGLSADKPVPSAFVP